MQKSVVLLLDYNESFSLKYPYVCKRMVNKTQPFSFQLNLPLTKCTKQHLN